MTAATDMLVTKKANLVTTVRDAEEAASELRSGFNATVEVSKGRKRFKGMYVQLDTMKRVFETYPSHLYFDATYRPNYLGLSCLLVALEDPNRHVEVVAIGFLAHQDLKSLSWFLDVFKRHNPQHCKLRAILTDKDPKEREVFDEAFPDADILISSYHSMRIFRNEINKKPGVTAIEKARCLRIFENMINASTEREYAGLYSHLHKVAPSSIVIYFLSNWHNLKSKWVNGLTFFNSVYFCTLLNQLDPIYTKLNFVAYRSNTLKRFSRNFINTICSLRQITIRRAALTVKKDVVLIPTPESLYSSFLTDHAFKMVLQQLRASETACKIIDSGMEFIVNLSGDTFIVSDNMCSCSFNWFLKLPCRHIFAVRRAFHRNLFDEGLCDKRWTSHDYKMKQNIINGSTFMTVEAFTPSTDRYMASSLPNAEDEEENAQLASENAAFVSSVPLFPVNGNVHMAPGDWEGENDDNHVRRVDAATVQRYEQLGSNSEASCQEPREIPKVSTCHPHVNGFAKVFQDRESVISSNHLRASNAPQIPAFDRNRENFQSHEYAAPVTASSTSSTRSNVGGLIKESQFECDTPNVNPSPIILPRIANFVIPQFVPVLRLNSPKEEVQYVTQAPKSKPIFKRPKAFCEIPKDEQIKTLLRWFVDEDTISKIFNQQHSICESNLNLSNPDQIHPGILHEKVDLYMIYKFFTKTAWMLVIETCKLKINIDSWRCSTCHSYLTKNTSISCDSCLLRYHYQCSGLYKLDQCPKMWFCNLCLSR